MEPSQRSDASNGYQSAADAFIDNRSSIGTAAVRQWAQSLPPGGAVLDLGCGHGVPVTQTLIEAGLNVYGVDASTRLLAELRLRFPGVLTERNAVENSEFFGRTFDGVVAWGLMFLLRPDVQTLVIRKVSRALNSGGKFLFTAPRQACEWTDALTGHTSVSLGAGRYHAVLSAEGFSLESEGQDERGNHYYLANKNG